MKFLVFLVLLPFLTMADEPKLPASNIENCGSVLTAHALKVATSKIISEQIEQNEVRDNLERLTGMKPLFESDSVFCLAQRCSQTYKIMARYFLLNKLLEYGFRGEHIIIETEHGIGSLGAQKAELSLSPSVLRLIVADGPVNIIGVIRGSTRPNEVVEIMAHYDTFSERVPGADDNGSGVVTALAAAKVLNKKSFAPDRSIRIVFDDLEERGMGGSRLHARTVKRQIEKANEVFVGALVIDMIGYFPSTGGAPEYVVEVGTERMHVDSSLAKSISLGNAVLDQLSSFPRLATGKALLKDAAPSTADHGRYWDAGLPAVLISTIYEGQYITPGYHNDRDTIETMKWPFFQAVLTDIVESLAHVADFKTSDEILNGQVVAKANAQHAPKDHVAIVAAAEKKEEDERPKYIFSRRSDPDDDFDFEWNRSNSDIRIPISSGRSINYPPPKPKGPASDVENSSTRGFLDSLFNFFSSEKDKKKISALAPEAIDLFTKKLMIEDLPTYLTSKELNFDDPEIAALIQAQIDSTAEIIFTSNYLTSGSATPKIRVGRFTFEYDTRGDTMKVRLYNPAQEIGSKGYVFSPPVAPNQTMRFASFLGTVLHLNNYRISYSSPIHTIHLASEDGVKPYTLSFKNGERNYNAEFELLEDGKFVRNLRHGYYLPVKQKDGNSIVIGHPTVGSLNAYLLIYGLGLNNAPTSAFELRAGLAKEPRKILGQSFRHVVDYGKHTTDIATLKRQKKKARKSTRTKKS